MNATEISPTAVKLSSQRAAAEIVALINSSPRSPRQEEIEAILARIGCAPAQEVPISDLRFRLRTAMAKSNATLNVLARLPDGAEFHIMEAERAMWEDEIAAMEKEIPNPPRSFQDLVARAEIARHGGDVVDGKLMEAEDEEDVFLGPAGRLIEAVLKFRGASSATAMSPAHAEHYREWRGLVGQHIRDFDEADEADIAAAEIAAREARMAVHLATMGELARRVFTVPAGTWGDVVLYAEICLWECWPGTDPEGSEARPELECGPGSILDDDPIAKLFEAIFSVAGIGHFAQAAACSEWGVE